MTSPDSTVSVERHGSTAVVLMHSQPVNCLNHALRTDLLATLEQVEHDSTITAVVLTGADRTFSAGADLTEFDRGEALLEPSLHLTITGTLDMMRTPVVAAIHGAALGGGLELALACHYRIATPDARLGLPEITLGLIPGAGGTQRLPRAVGFETALNLVLGGSTVTGTVAQGLGLVDEVVLGDLVDAAVRFVQRVALTAPPRLRDVEVRASEREGLIAFARRAAGRSRATRPGTGYALDALAATALPFDDGLATELRLFQSLCASTSAPAFRYRFLAERRAGRVKTAGSRVPNVATAAVIGGGTMGRGIALALLAAGISVVLVETDQDRADAAAAAVMAELKRRRLKPEQFRGEVGLRHIGDADLVIEAVFEDLAVKQAVFAEMDRHAKPGALLASNTSSLDLDAIAGVTGRPADVVGLHFFSPADVMRLVEIIEGAATSADTLARAARITRQLNKIGVVSGVGDGFIGNRVMDAYVRQAMILLSRGVPPDRVDAVLESWGMAMGPFRVLDLVGNDIPWQARQARGATGPEWWLADQLAIRGLLGRKSGAGWYRYPQRTLNPEVGDLIAEWCRDPAAISDDEIVQRCVYALVNEAAAVMQDGVARRASDIDVVFLNGYGFPAERGGPLHHADHIGLDRVIRAMRRFAWTPTPLLTEYARDGLSITTWEKATA
ncbi:3-hydroxyacyl-CoA dehydrogenase NAD-binding domain-containing protein [Kutzneria sp. NPDC051319]|uniref:3-hydroxyacyl-CoA dehydrogenase NAD-binding domain-containing protein n=1 Tax=Kutzneria sp. NPDC051319 TaxID=3155047 RepID=UPI00341F9806